MSRKKRIRSDHRADLRGGRFIGLPSVVKDSDAYGSLSLFERAVLIEILAAFNGYNNGRIVISQRQIADNLKNSNFRKIGKSIAVLCERGLLDVATDSVWKDRRAREYRLTFISSGVPPFVRPASNEYLSWKNDADAVSTSGGRTADSASTVALIAADGSSAQNATNGRNP